MSFAKGMKPQTAEYAKGGSTLGRTRDFMKEPDRFRGTPNPKVETSEDDYPKTGKGGKLSKETGDKCLPAVKPKK